MEAHTTTRTRARWRTHLQSREKCHGALVGHEGMACHTASQEHAQWAVAVNASCRQRVQAQNQDHTKVHTCS